MRDLTPRQAAVLRPGPTTPAAARYIRIFLLLVVAFLQLESQETRHVVIAVLDGARYVETFGDSTHANIPFIWNHLKPLGTAYTSFRNDGITWTNSSHCCILNGTRDSVQNDGSQRPHAPTIFEYYRKQTGKPAEHCWVVLGKTKLDMLSYSARRDYGAGYGAKVIFSPSEYDDIKTFENSRTVLTTYRPALSIINLAETDEVAHRGDWKGYIRSIRQADLLIGLIWHDIQSDSVMRDRTTLIVLNDHGRHSTNFVSHGDHCEGCMHIMMLIIGPDTPAGVVDSEDHWQVDVAPTVARLLKFETPETVGSVIWSAMGRLKKPAGR